MQWKIFKSWSRSHYCITTGSLTLILYYYSSQSQCRKDIPICILLLVCSWVAQSVKWKQLKCDRRATSGSSCFLLFFRGEGGGVGELQPPPPLHTHTSQHFGYVTAHVVNNDNVSTSCFCLLWVTTKNEMSHNRYLPEMSQ